MASSLLGPLLLLSLGNTVRMNSVLRKSYRYIPDHYTWEDAQSCCRKSGQDLVFINAESEFVLMIKNQYDAWIGPYKNDNDDWVWPSGDQQSINWCKGQPEASDTCAYGHIYGSSAYGTDCEESIFFFCCVGSRDDNEFIPVSKTWSEARDYCDKFHKGLSTFAKDKLEDALVEHDFPVWIGLRRNGTDWNWTRGTSNFTSWGEGQPESKGDCASVSSVSNQMATHNCSDRFPSVCFGDNLVVATENKTWEEALEHCRSLEVSPFFGSRYDMVSVQPDDHTYFRFRMKEEALTQMVWTGLRFLAGHWIWINGIQQLPPGLPAYPPMDRHCAILSGSELDVVEIRDCSEKWNFMCYRKY